ncbi:TrbC/VirB2 family protein [Erythrobacter sp. THAF29]|uniref:TrbC/VirB2 family protein n=1 Tax=Erythrobacter sp. THAF29 TaxID=2587851 RepID=UPI001267D1EC|nr:TrbC/VirB2 family protein [Erythrobacter sp. THAF29]QFT78518.1 TrbC/VIRB2 family protein [Erythrobacter sp. THAF29]
MTQSSLLNPSAESPLSSSMEWIASVLFGEVALGLCVLAVAFVGALMLTGRLAVREGLRVPLGCFILLGAPLIAGAFIQSAEKREISSLPNQHNDDFGTRDDLEPATHDPYSGA